MDIWMVVKILVGVLRELARSGDAEIKATSNCSHTYRDGPLGQVGLVFGLAGLVSGWSGQWSAGLVSGRSGRTSLRTLIWLAGLVDHLVSLFFRLFVTIPITSFYNGQNQ